MNLDELFQQGWFALRTLWSWLNYQVRDNPILGLGAVIVLLILWRVMTPNPRLK